jgi:hypothetical protein
MMFLRLRHWQIFLIAWGPLTAVLLVLFNFPDLILGYFPIVLGLFLIGLANSFAWVWAIVKKLKKLVPFLSTTLFRIAFWIPFTFIWTNIAFALYNLRIRKVQSINVEIELLVSAVLGIISVACIIYGLIFAGRIIKAAELQKEPSIKEHLMESCLMLLPPIGLWFIQPKLNKIVHSTSGTKSN